MYDQFNFNYREGGFDLTGMLSGGHYDNSQGAITTVDVHSANHWRVKNDMSKQKNINHTLSGTLSMNYQFNPDHVMGVRYKLSRDPKIRIDGTALAEAFKDGTMYEQSDARYDIGGQFTSHDINAYYNGKVNDWSIDLNLDGMWHKTKQNQFTAQTITETSRKTMEENMSSIFSCRSIYEDSCHSSRYYRDYRIYLSDQCRHQSGCKYNPTFPVWEVFRRNQ